MGLHNNVVPSSSNKYRKHWQKRVKVNFKQEAKRRMRRFKRLEKAKKLFPRPLHTLKPVVNIPGNRYRGKTRYGKGFSLQELKAIELTVKQAHSVGIAFDKRRVNKSQETLDRNVERLKEYLSKIYIKPTKGEDMNRQRRRAQNFRNEVERLARIAGEEVSEEDKERIKRLERPFTTERKKTLYQQRICKTVAEYNKLKNDKMQLHMEKILLPFKSEELVLPVCFVTKEAEKQNPYEMVKKALEEQKEAGKKKKADDEDGLGTDGGKKKK